MNQRSCSQRENPVVWYAETREKVYTQIVKNCFFSELVPIIKGKADTGSVLYSDVFNRYDGLVNYEYKKHFRGKHGDNEFADGYNHINGIENFRGVCKVRLAKFRGVLKLTFYLQHKRM